MGFPERPLTYFQYALEFGLFVIVFLVIRDNPE